MQSKRVRHYEESVGACLARRHDSSLKIVEIVELNGTKFHTENRRRSVQHFHLLYVRLKIRIHENGHPGDLGNQLF
jgi:hypothetical protein